MDDNPTVVFTGPNQVVLETREKPSPEAGELLIRTKRSLISTGTELTMLSGDYPPGSRWEVCGKYPVLPGYDNVGEVSTQAEA